VLSFSVVHTLSSCLLAADADADTSGWGDPPTLLLIHDRRQHPAAPPCLREMRSVEFPLHPDDLLADPAGLPALLHRLATGLEHPDSARALPYQAALDTIVGLIRETDPAARLLAWAVLYHDIGTASGQPQQVRRVEAVDTDGRVYQLTRIPGEDHPLLVVDDTPDPVDTPATYPGLVALLAAAARSTLADAGRTTW
jgi:hypothetical protein